MSGSGSGEFNLQDVGERLHPSFVVPWAAEHLHRYAVALPWCEGKDVLDLASGEGYGTNLLAGVARWVTGVDISEEAVTHASRRYTKQNLAYKQGLATKVPLDDDAVDVVVSFETLEHLEDHEGMLAEIRRVLRPDGLLVMSTPDKRHFPDRRIFPDLREGEVPVNPFHVRELTLGEFKALIGSHFKHSTYLFQRLSYGSLIVPEDGDGAAGYRDLRGDFDGVTVELRVPDPVFVVALASDGALPPTQPVSFQDGWAVLAGQERYQRRVWDSPSHRLGRALTWPLRAVVKPVRKRLRPRGDG